MKSTTWHREWIVGFFKEEEPVTQLVREGLKMGLDKEEFLILAPPRLGRKGFAGVKKESLYPEMKRVFIGAGIGFLIASVGVHFLFMQGAGFSSNIAMDIAVAAIRGFGGAIIGAIFGMVESGVDAALISFYEDEGGDSIMVAIRCDPKNVKSFERAEELIQNAGSSTFELPIYHRRPVPRKLAIRH